jgi:phospholipase/lecithinase/hemolysin
MISWVRNASFRVLILVLLGGLASLPASAGFSQLYLFGDSLLDVGNVQAATTALSPLAPITPGPYYFNGRFSNGANFGEVLSGGLGLGAVSPSSAGGNDYAYGGALATGTAFPTSLVVQDVDDQVTQYLTAHPVGNADALYLVYAGSNDVLSNPGGVSAAANSLGASIGRLYDAGARQVLVPNLPLLGLIPRNNGNAGDAAAANAATVQFNSALAMALDQLQAAHSDLTVYRLDVAGVFAGIIADPGAVGLTNVTDSAAPGLEPGDQSYDTSLLVGNSDGYLFWDDLHPTRAGHLLLGEAALAAVPEPSSLVVVLLVGVGFLGRRGGSDAGERAKPRSECGAATAHLG